MNLSLLDEYVLLVLKSNGWTEERDFPLADDWIHKIEQSGVERCEYARGLLHSLGGMKIREYSPSAALYFLRKYNGDRKQLGEEYLRPLNFLDSLREKRMPEAYTGATFTFDAWGAFLDWEIVMDLKTAEEQTGEKLFPIGTVEPDGISCATEKGNIYTIFDDSIFLSGDSIESYLNTLFIKQLKPRRIM